jgi:hypothetical protein
MLDQEITTMKKLSAIKILSNPISKVSLNYLLDDHKLSELLITDRMDQRTPLAKEIINLILLYSLPKDLVNLR